MKSLYSDESTIEEVVFFATTKIDYFMALVQENADCFYLAGRIMFSSGYKKLVTLSGKDRTELREKMMLMGENIARMYDAQFGYVIFPMGVSTHNFVQLLREANSNTLISWSKNLLSKYPNQN